METPAFKVGDRIIARKLTANANQPKSTNTMPPRVAKIVGERDDDYLITLRIVAGGQNRWNKKPRTCPKGNVARLATDREVAVGMVIEAL